MSATKIKILNKTEGDSGIAYECLFNGEILYIPEQLLPIEIEGNDELEIIQDLYEVKAIIIEEK